VPKRRAPAPAQRFAPALIAWQRRHGRHDLPWQGTQDPYRIWVAEIMLQQTQVSTAIPYYRRFLARFPSLAALARAPEEDVLRAWSGLGYYARARNLHRAACRLRDDPGGGFPRTPEKIAELPGIGRSTAAAIAVFAFGARAAILDGNVKRVLARAFGIDGDGGAGAHERRLWALAESLLPRRDLPAYTQALMDLGATVCTRARPACDACPVARDCVARREGRTAELPAPRARIRAPRRHARWLVLRDGNRVLLERRAPSGLWGGLWAFPAAPGRGLAAHCRREFGCEVGAAHRLAPVEHAFTHFTLIATPRVCTVRAGGRGAARAEMPGRKWLSFGAAAAEALPAPVRALIGRLRAGALRHGNDAG